MLFLGLLIVTFLALQQGYLWGKEHHDYLLNHVLNAAPASGLINLLSPGRPVHAHDGVITTPHKLIDIHKGCEGFEVMIIMIAAMVALPAPWRLRLAGAALGALWIYVMNLLRILGLYVVFTYAPAWSEFAHLAVGQTVMILVGGIFFLAWTEWVAKRRRPAAAEPSS